MQIIFTLEFSRNNNSINKKANNAIDSVELLLPNHTETGAMAKQTVYIMDSIPFTSSIVFFIKKNMSQMFTIAMILCPQKIEIFFIGANKAKKYDPPE